MSTPLTPIFAALLNGLDAAYRRGTPLLSDAIFDKLAQLCPNALASLGAAAGDAPPLLSLDCPAEPEDWLARNPGPYAVQLKADGVSVALTYLDGCFVSARLRGGRDCTAAALQAGALTDLPGRPAGRVEVRCEAISLGRGAAAQISRNAVAAILRRNDRAAAAASLSLLAFDLVGLDAVPTRSAAATWLECAGFATLRCSVTHSPAAVLSALETFAATQHHLPLTCDGLVVSLDSKARQRDLGATSRAPRWSISLKP
jgi:DNA ligase (NAD+)